MSKITIILEDDGIVDIVTKDYGNSAILADEYMQACISAYQAFKYQNNVTVKFPGSPHLDTIKLKINS